MQIFFTINISEKLTSPLEAEIFSNLANSFGEKYYFNGAVEKINKIINEGYNCYVLTDNPDFFNIRYRQIHVHVFEYDRSYKSYSDKMQLPKKILKNHDISILIDADTHITDYSFLESLKTYNFKKGISYIDTLLNHSAKKEFVKELVNETTCI